MASNNVLTEAIIKLENANAALRERIQKEPERADEFLAEITRNKSMILDYKFRLEHDE